MHLTSTPWGIGGVEQLLIDSADLYASHGIDVSFVNLFGDGGDGIFAARLRQRGARVTEIAGRQPHEIPAILLRLISALRASRPDVLHMHMFHATVLGSVAGALVHSPLRVVTRHYLSAGYAHRAWPGRAADAAAIRAADHVIAISRAVRQDLVGRFRVPERRVSVIPNGINVARFDDGSARGRRPRANGRAIVVGTLGSLVPWKGHAVLIRAVAAVAGHGRDVRLLIAGEGTERANLESLIAQLGMGDRIQLIGFQADAAAFLRGIDLYVHPSLDEALGLAVLEAMAAGCAVVAAATGGILDIVTSPDLGVLVPPGDVDATVAAIEALIADESHRTTLAKNGRRHVVQHFSVSSFVQRYAELYQQLAVTRGCADAGPDGR